MSIKYRAANNMEPAEAAMKAITAAEIFNEPVELIINGANIMVREEDSIGVVTRKIEDNENSVDRIRKWVRDRNLHTADPKVQLGKLLEEAGELSSAVLKENETGVVDGIGDCVVVLICLAEQLKLDFNRCVNVAYNEIKDRKGKLVNGIFVKEKDL